MCLETFYNTIQMWMKVLLEIYIMILTVDVQALIPTSVLSMRGNVTQGCCWE